MNDDELKLKRSKSTLSSNVSISLPLIEEITKKKLIPLCLIGFSVKPDGHIQVHFATHNKGADIVLLEVCRMLVESKIKK